jgi:hypothetical protein
MSHLNHALQTFASQSPSAIKKHRMAIASPRIGNFISDTSSAGCLPAKYVESGSQLSRNSISNPLNHFPPPTPNPRLPSC